MIIAITVFLVGFYAISEKKEDKCQPFILHF